MLNEIPIVSDSYLSNKELQDVILSKELRAKGVITAPGNPFELSKQAELDGLTEKGVFRFVEYNPKIMDGLRIFNSRLVNETKGKATSTPYEKFRLVIQAYNDD